ncbi:dnaJ homolog subfamily C member 11-like [Mya arenaria]|uniref:dnaJ homolog subfamily C member 11-like n=1 Tax=Mya arenaria TaxID=6604 RepID=UPI0022E7A6C8|nr:dnaJ homolog subfamily C member 11-like [Mya arenaria]
MAAPLDDEEDALLKEDFYALFNVSREATKEEINAAYKQMSRIYHPDKHQDPDKKKNAEVIFDKLKKAHEVLMDQRKRTIYDLYGKSGLESYGLEVVSRVKTPAEIIAEYERIKRDEEEKRLQRQTNPQSTSTISVDASSLFESNAYDYEDDDDDEEDYDVIDLTVPEINSMTLSQSVECPLTSRDTGTLAWQVNAQDGRGSGNFRASYKRFTTKGTLVSSVMVGSKQDVSFKWSHVFFRRCDLSLSAKLVPAYNSTSILLAPRLGAGLVFMFDKNWQWRFHLNWPVPALSNTLIYTSEKRQIITQAMLTIKGSYMTVSYTHKFHNNEGSITVQAKAGTTGFHVEVGVQKTITSFSTIGATVSLGTSGVGLALKMDRGQHTILVPVTLAHEIVPSAVFYGTVAPIVFYVAVKNLIVTPFLAMQKERDVERQKQEQQEKMQEKKTNAESMVELMKETVERITEAEERKNGLIIITAVYGKLSSESPSDLQSADCIDVTVQLQALVKDSKLISPEKNSKSDLPGFYDPCYGEDKKLYIKYKFRKKLHHTTLNDQDSIRLPQQRHLLREEELPPFIQEDPDP